MLTTANWILYILMAFLVSDAGITSSSWHFWAFWILLIAISLVNYAEGRAAR